MNGDTRSCGCLRSEMMRDKQYKHGHAKRSAEYNAWSGMKQRCAPDHKWAKNYRGRGITYCQRWEVFENFLTDMGARPSPKHSIDRADNDLGYFPENCRWATQSEQMRNTRRTPKVSWRGGKISAVDLAEQEGVTQYRLIKLVRAGVPANDAVAQVRATMRKRAAA